MPTNEELMELEARDRRMVSVAIPEGMEWVRTQMNDATFTSATVYFRAKAKPTLAETVRAIVTPHEAIRDTIADRLEDSNKTVLSVATSIRNTSTVDAAQRAVWAFALEQAVRL